MAKKVYNMSAEDLIKWQRYLKSPFYKAMHKAIKTAKRYNRHDSSSTPYSNRPAMQRARKEKITSTNGKCEDCGCTPAKLEIHHIDKTKFNHSMENLKILCIPCHMGKYHIGKRKAY